MSNQQDLFERARAEMKAAVSAVEDAADNQWLDVAYGLVVEVARHYQFFISDDVWAHGLPNTREDRALGAVFQRAKRAGIIAKTDRVRPSIRSHLSGKPVWKSLIFGCPQT